MSMVEGFGGGTGVTGRAGGGGGGGFRRGGILPVDGRRESRQGDEVKEEDEEQGCGERVGGRVESSPFLQAQGGRFSGGVPALP